jgi:hypothetical protein
MIDMGFSRACDHALALAALPSIANQTSKAG